MLNIVFQIDVGDLGLGENKYYKSFLESSHTLASLIQKRGGEVNHVGAELYTAAVESME